MVRLGRSGILRPGTLMAFLLASACTWLLAEVYSFLVPPLSRRPTTMRRPQQFATQLQASESDPGHDDKVAERNKNPTPAPDVPRPPRSSGAMTAQAAEAVMNGYRDGLTRQSVRLRLDVAYNAQVAYTGGIAAKLKGALPLAESFVRKLWGGEMLKALRPQAIDATDAGTLIYRQAVDNLYDSAIFFLIGRTLVTSDKVRRYFDKMGDRLVVLLNSEDSADPFKVQNQAKDFVIGEDVDIGAEVTETFKEITYYYSVTIVNNWQLIEYRAYPHPWEIWVENLDYDLEYIGSWDVKPTYDEITDATIAYEERNGISQAKKLAKVIKDQGQELAEFSADQMRPGEGRKL